ncbi:hypothetical protein ACHAXR_001956, partial [Thalassiosira sp. AJA248-18]
MQRSYHPIIFSFVISFSWLASVCHSFSFDGSSSSSFATRPHPTLVRHRRRSSPSPCYPTTTTSIGTSCFHPKTASSLTIRWNSPTDTIISPENQETTIIDLHPPTLQAIAQALVIRAQNTPDMPLRFIDDGSMEPWQITMSCGKIAQSAAEEWARQEQLNPMENEADQELMQVMAGRVVAVLTRLEELEEDLLNRCCSSKGNSDDDEFSCLGVPDEELKAWQQTDNNDSNNNKRVSDAAAAIDAACLFDEPLRNKRARSLLAMFLHEIEGPGLRANNVVIPCMDVDFLPADEWDMLFSSKDGEEGGAEVSSDSDDESGKSERVDAIADDSDEEETADKSGDDMAEDDEVSAPRPSLHPITIDAIEEAFRLRAQNSTTSPLRFLNQQSEWFEIQYSIMKFADRYLEKYSAKKAVAGNSDDADDVFQWTEEELQTIGGRIVGVLMRLDDLEWEWNHRIRTSLSFVEVDYPSTIPNEMWKTTLGLHPDNMEQNCVRTVDMALLEEKE